jgi:hypothetical protein
MRKVPSLQRPMEWGVFVQADLQAHFGRPSSEARGQRGLKARIKGRFRVRFAASVI